MQVHFERAAVRAAPAAEPIFHSRESAGFVRDEIAHEPVQAGRQAAIVRRLKDVRPERDTELQEAAIARSESDVPDSPRQTVADSKRLLVDVLPALPPARRVFRAWLQVPRELAVR